MRWNQTTRERAETLPTAVAADLRRLLSKFQDARKGGYKTAEHFKKVGDPEAALYHAAWADGLKDAANELIRLMNRHGVVA